MGRAARNYGGTRGHGYFPLPGERPNFNYHVLNDSDLFSIVKTSERKLLKSEGLKVVHQPQTDKDRKSFSFTKQPEKCEPVLKVKTTNRSPSQEKKLLRDYPLVTKSAGAKRKKEKKNQNKVNGEASTRKDETSQIDLQRMQTEYKQGTLIEGDKPHEESQIEPQVSVSKHEKNSNFASVHLSTEVRLNRINSYCHI